MLLKTGRGWAISKNKPAHQKLLKKKSRKGPEPWVKKCPSTRSCCVLKNTSYLKVMLQKIAICQKLNGTSVTE